jgi:hypothetical protein
VAKTFGGGLGGRSASTDVDGSEAGSAVVDSSSANTPFNYVGDKYQFKQLPDFGQEPPVLQHPDHVYQDTATSADRQNTSGADPAGMLPTADPEGIGSIGMTSSAGQGGGGCVGPPASVDPEGIVKQDTASSADLPGPEGTSNTGSDGELSSADPECTSSVGMTSSADHGGCDCVGTSAFVDPEGIVNHVMDTDHGTAEHQAQLPSLDPTAELWLCIVCGAENPCQGPQKCHSCWSWRGHEDDLLYRPTDEHLLVPASDAHVTSTLGGTALPHDRQHKAPGSLDPPSAPRGRARHGSDLQRRKAFGKDARRGA